MSSIPGAQMRSGGGAADAYENMATRFDDVPIAEENEEKYVDYREALPAAFSEDAMATSWCNRHSQKYKFTAGLDWMMDVGDHWADDEKLTRFDLSRQVCREFAARCDDKQQMIARRLSSAPTINNVLTISKSDPRCAMSASAWDSDIYALNTPAGIVDLRTGNIRPRAGDFVTQITTVSPDPFLPMPTWSKFLDDVFQQDESYIEFWQRMIGYFLTGSIEEQKVFVAWGLGGNGKSVLVDLIAKIMGSYSIRMPSEALMQQRENRHPTEIAMLRGKRLALSSELEEGCYWSESKLKALTGDEQVTARFMRGDFFQFNQSQKHLIVGNYRPRMRGGDAAMARRMILMPFRAVFSGDQRDKNISAKLWTEAPAILAWCIQGAVAWRTDGGLKVPEIVRAASEDYVSSQDDTLLWIDECCVKDTQAVTRASELYESFSTWLVARGQRPPSMRIWGDRMATMPQFPKRLSAGVRYQGIRLTEAETLRLRDLPPSRRIW